MLEKFAIELFKEVADECDLRLLVESNSNNDLFVSVAAELTNYIEKLVDRPE